MQLTSNTVRKDEESDKDSSFNVSEKVESATQIDDSIEALKDDCNVSLSTQLIGKIENKDLIEAVDHKVSIFTESICMCLCIFV